VVGAAAHACELETSAYLYLTRRWMDLARHMRRAGKEGSQDLSVDLRRAGDDELVQ